MMPFDALEEDQFVLSVSAISTGEALYDYLVASLEVKSLTAALRADAVSTIDVARFVSRLMLEFRRGMLFSGDAILAAIAVAIQSYPGKVASDLLEELSSLKLREMPLAPRVASLALKQRAVTVAAATDRTFRFTPLSYPVLRHAIVVDFSQCGSTSEYPALKMVTTVRGMHFFHAAQEGLPRFPMDSLTRTSDRVVRYGTS